MTTTDGARPREIEAEADEYEAFRGCCRVIRGAQIPLRQDVIRLTQASTTRTKGVSAAGRPGQPAGYRPRM